jgi:hypothetical protein
MYAPIPPKAITITMIIITIIVFETERLYLSSMYSHNFYIIPKYLYFSALLGPGNLSDHCLANQKLDDARST